MKNVFERPKIFHFFSFDSKEFQIHNVGYDDFYYTLADKTSRAQYGYTLHYVLSGNGTLFINGNKYDIKEGQMFFLPPNESFMYYPSENAPWKYIWFFMCGSLVEKYGKIMGFSLENPIKNCPFPKETESLLRNMFIELDNFSDRYYKTVSTFYEIMNKTIKTTEKSDYIYNSDVVERIKETIYLNYRNTEFTVQLLADMLHISHSYLCKLFKAKNGISVVKFLKNVRLNKAAELLMQGNYLNKEICEMTGYGDEAHFMKEFKKQYGVSAKKYRSSFISK